MINILKYIKLILINTFFYNFFRNPNDKLSFSNIKYITSRSNTTKQRVVMTTFEYDYIGVSSPGKVDFIPAE